MRTQKGQWTQPLGTHREGPGWRTYMFVGYQDMGRDITHPEELGGSREACLHGQGRLPGGGACAVP